MMLSTRVRDSHDFEKRVKEEYTSSTHYARSGGWMIEAEK